VQEAEKQVRAPAKPLAPHIPGNAGAAVIVRRGALEGWQELLDEPPELREQLGAYLEKTLGVDVTTVEGAVLYMVGEDDAALFLQLERPGRIRREPVATHGSTPLFKMDDAHVASLSSGIVLGDESAVRLAVDLQEGKVPPLGPGAPLGFLLEEGLDQDVVIGLSAAGSSDPQIGATAAQFGLGHVLLTYGPEGDGRVIRLVITGKPEGLRQLKAMYDVAIAGLQAGLAEAESEAGDDVAKGAGAIIASHKARHLLAEIEPRLEGSTLTAQYRFPDTKIESTTAIGMMAAVAIPAFIRYIRKAKTAEAVQNVTQMHQRALEMGNAKRQFPKTTPWTPREPCCSQPGNKCSVTPQTFAHPTWRVLGFAPQGQFHYQYRFTRTGRGRRARFAVEARGDLDCDGQFSSFRREGYMEKGEAVGTDLEIHDEIE